MDRVIVYPGAIPLETDLLNTNRFTLTAIAKLAQAALGTSGSSTPVVHGLACTPTSPASMQVTVAGGQIYAVEDLDASAYSSLPADTAHSVLKQGVILDATSFTITPPTGAGQSVVYLVEAAYADVDGNAVTLPYYNAANPSQAYAGPNNTGVAQNTVRQGQCVLQLKEGLAATTGTQVAPAVDPGYVALWQITVANGATSITSPNIAEAPGAPFIAGLLNQHHLGVAGNAPKISLTQEVQGTLPYANLPPGLAPHGQCRLAFVSTTQIALQPWGGFLVSNNGGALQLPAGGVAAANTSVTVGGTAGQNLAAASAYDVYLNSAGTLEFWLCPTAGGIPGASTHMPDTTAGNIGVEVHNNAGTPDSAKTYVGKVYTDASAHFQDTSSQRYVASWFNRRARAPYCDMGGNMTTSGSLVAMSSAKAEFLVFADEPDVLAILDGYVQTFSGAAQPQWTLVADGSNTLSVRDNTFMSFAASTSAGKMVASGMGVLAEGYHYLQGFHSCTSGSGGIESFTDLKGMVRM